MKKRALRLFFFTDFVGALHRISVCYGSGKGDEDTYTFSDDQSSCQDDCSEDGMLAEDSLNSEAVASKRVCRQ